jgi:shikimate dehydrogenase
MSSQLRTLAVVGHPIGHSLSPALHTAAYEQLGLPWKYVAVDVQPGDFDSFLSSTDATLRGLSVTMPHKASALEAADTLDLLSERTGSVNTLLCGYNESGERSLSGFNTDVFGIVNALKDSGVEQAHHVAVIGGGATASSAVAAAAEIGAEHVSVIVRSPHKAFHLETVGQQCGVNVSVHSFEHIAEIAEVEVAISTLPGDAEQSLVGLPKTSRATLLDVAYSPWPSARGAEWATLGGEVVSGLRMLAHQAVVQVRIFVNGSPFEPLHSEVAVKEAMFAAVGLDSL